MNKFIAIDDIEVVFTKHTIPSITLWNRLESRPRNQDSVRPLMAEIRDPLWMLTKQWQIGEFQGDDAGSPSIAKVQIATTELTKYQADQNESQIFDNSLPLEAMVEQKKIPFTQDEKKVSLQLRLFMGRQWLKMLKKDFPGLGLSDTYIEKFGFPVPDPTDEKAATIVAHKEVWQKIDAIAGRAMDGYSFYEHLNANVTNTASNAVIDSENDDLNLLGDKFSSWFERLILQPKSEAEDAWLPERMEYQFKVSAPEESSEKVLTANEYFHGHLDWYNLDINPNQNPLSATPSNNPPARITQSFFPAPLQMGGMPNARWWEFEDSNVNLNDIKPDTTDLNKLLFIEFALLNGTDWFHIPFTVDAGSIVSIKGLSVTNVFGEKIWVEAAGKGKEEDWQRWNMYGLNIKGEQEKPADNSLLILPTVQNIQEGKPLEEIVFIRDEVSNMVWGIEKKIQTATGGSKHGKEAADELTSFYQRILDKKTETENTPTDPIKYKAAIRYEIMNTVPENWIPFIPVQVPGSNREVQLQRASLPRILKNDAPENAKKIKPRTQLLREGLDTLAVEAYFINEEEVPRAGVNLFQTFQRARWYNGKVVTWLGARKHTGRGEGSGGLAFDRILPTEEA